MQIVENTLSEALFHGAYFVAESGGFAHRVEDDVADAGVATDVSERCYGHRVLCFDEFLFEFEDFRSKVFPYGGRGVGEFFNLSELDKFLEYDHSDYNYS